MRQTTADRVPGRGVAGGGAIRPQVSLALTALVIPFAQSALIAALNTDLCCGFEDPIALGGGATLKASRQTGMPLFLKPEALQLYSHFAMETLIAVAEARDFMLRARRPFSYPQRSDG